MAAYNFLLVVESNIEEIKLLNDIHLTYLTHTFKYDAYTGSNFWTANQYC